MKEIIVPVEGQTEETFASDVLVPAALSRGFLLQPSVVKTSSTPSGARRGGGGWKNYDEQLRSFFQQKHFYRIGLLIDYYQYPTDAPGREFGGTDVKRQQSLIRALRDHYRDPRFRPLVVLHEIEALVLAAIDAGQNGLIPARGLDELRRAIALAGGPEQVNDGPSTAPSKRLTEAYPGYIKYVTGPELITAAGLGAVLARCPTFAAWWQNLLST